VLWRVGGGPYRDERELHALARAIDWTKHFRADRTIRVDVAATRSPLKSLEFATLTIKDAWPIASATRRASGRRSTSARPTCASTRT
jgi:putative N6-adenine-specific DNA methylase